jgi:hypothetical protein
VKKIVSPRPVDLAPEAFCKFKGLEGHLYKVVSLGTEADMKARLSELDGGLDAVDKSPPRKRACTKRSSTQKKGKGKDKTPQSAKRKVNKQQGRILLVGAKPQKLSEISADSQGNSGDQPSTSKQSEHQPSISTFKQPGDQPSTSTSKQSKHWPSASKQPGD